MQRLLKDNMEKIRALCLAYNVKNLYAFSSICTSHFNENSDVGLLISFMPLQYGDYADANFDLAEKFEEFFQRPVDLVTDKSLKNPYFIQSVDQTKTLLYGE
jgi:Predicted nucleotidyltransferases